MSHECGALPPFALLSCAAQQRRMWDNRRDYFEAILGPKMVKQDKRNTSDRSIGQKADVHIKGSPSEN